MDANQRIKDLLAERGWSEYRLAKQANLNQSTIATLLRRNTTPSVATIEAICSALGISLAQFFTPSNNEQPLIISKEQRELLEQYSFLPEEAKIAVRKIILEINKK